MIWSYRFPKAPSDCDFATLLRVVLLEFSQTQCPFVFPIRSSLWMRSISCRYLKLTLCFFHPPTSEALLILSQIFLWFPLIHKNKRAKKKGNKLILSKWSSTSNSLSLWPRLPTADAIDLIFPIFSLLLASFRMYSSVPHFYSSWNPGLSWRGWNGVATLFPGSIKGGFGYLYRGLSFWIFLIKNHRIGNLPSSFLGFPFLCKFFLHFSLGKPTLFLRRYLKT